MILDLIGFSVLAIEWFIIFGVLAGVIHYAPQLWDQLAAEGVGEEDDE